MKTKKIFLIGITVFLVAIIASSTSSAVLMPWTEVIPGNHDYITYYYLDLGEGFWADYAGEVIEFQMGFSLDGSDIIAWGDADFIPWGMYADPTGFLYINPEANLIYNVHLVPFLALGFLELWNPVFDFVWEINPNQKTAATCGCIDVDQERNPHKKYDNFDVLFQFRVDGEEWPEEWYTLGHKTIKLKFVFSYLITLGVFSLDFDGDGVYDFEGNYFGGDYTKLSFIFFKILDVLYHL
jgi:hypothetical protein